MRLRPTSRGQSTKRCCRSRTPPLAQPFHMPSLCPAGDRAHVLASDPDSGCLRRTVWQDAVANQQSEVRVSDIHNTQDKPAGVVTPQKMERKGRELGRSLELSLEPPFRHKVVPDPPVDSREMPGPIAEVYQLCVRKTGDIERDYYQEDERLRQEVAADAQTIERAAGLDLPAPSQRLRTLFYAPLMVAFGVAEACVRRLRIFWTRVCVASVSERKVRHGREEPTARESPRALGPTCSGAALEPRGQAREHRGQGHTGDRQQGLARHLRERCDSGPECVRRTTGDTSPRFVPPVTGETVFENPLLKPSRSPATSIGRRLSGPDRTVVYAVTRSSSR